MLDGHSADDKAMAPFFVDKAELYVAEYDLEKAETYYRKAMEMINNSYGSKHLYTANVIAKMAKLNTMQGKYDQAEKMIDKAISLQEKIYGPEHHLVATSWLTKAKICQAKGQFAQTDKLIDRTLAAIEKSGNTTAFAKLRQDAKDIHMNKQVALASTERIFK